MRKFLSFFIATIILLTFPQSTIAQADWSINSFHSDIAIQADGRVKITETIDVDFQSLDKHGIYRDIPYVYYTSSEDTKYTQVKVNEVRLDGKKEPFDVTTNKANIRIIIGDEDRTISGEHTYLVTYTASGVIVPYPTYDELYWNVTGNGWEASIAKATATLQLSQPGIIQTACYVGIKGSTTQCRDEKVDEQTARFSTDTLQASEGMTIATGFQKGLVPIISVERPKSLWERLLAPINLLFFVLLTALGIGLILRKWWQEGRDYWTKNILTTSATHLGSAKPLGSHETIVVEFTPPEKLRPAELGVLVDEKADTLDITATVIDLARQGYLSIEEVKKKWLLGKSDYIMNRSQKTATNLLPYEEVLLTRLFGKEKAVKLSSLKLTFYDDLKHVKKKLYETVTNKKLFFGNPETVRQRYLLFGILIVAVPVFLLAITFALFLSTLVITATISSTIIGLTLIMFSQKMPRRTAYGRDIYRRALGYRLFISGAEKYRQQFYEKKNLFDEVLPYSIVFSLTEKFAKAMQDIGIKPHQPPWYTGYSAFNPAVFAMSMNSFSKTLSTTMASAPSSSGSGGGGSSGGGFGGGGGGSW